METRDNVLINAENLQIGYVSGKSEVTVCKDMSFELRRGELVALLGPNGAGKSTLLRTLSASQSPLLGEVCCFGKALKDFSQKELSRVVSVVLTDNMQAGGLTVHELVSLGRQPYTGFFGRLSAVDKRLIDEAINSVGLDHKSKSYVSELSDGERQKTLIAKALVQETDVLLLDEPAAFLDAVSKLEIISLLRQIAVERRRAVLFSTHDVEQALTLSDKLWLMKKDGLVCGVTEDLIMRGLMSDLFPSNKVTFDLSGGNYRLNEKSDKLVSVTAQNPELLFWLKNALQRNGYGITDQPSRCEIAVKAHSSEQIELKTKNNTFTCRSFKEMVEKLTELTIFAMYCKKRSAKKYSHSSLPTGALQ